MNKFQLTIDVTAVDGSIVSACMATTQGASDLEEVLGSLTTILVGLIQSLEQENKCPGAIYSITREAMDTMYIDAAPAKKTLLN